MIQLTTEYVKKTIGEILEEVDEDSGSSPFINSLIEKVESSDWADLIGGAMQFFTEKSIERHMKHGDNPTEAMVKGSMEAQMTFSLLLIAVGIKFRDATLEELEKADVDGFIADALGGTDG